VGSKRAYDQVGRRVHVGWIHEPFHAAAFRANFVFAAAQTGLPALQGVALPGGNVGFPYASFLLGMANTASIGNPVDPQYRKYALGLFVQDTWRLTRKLTLDYGLRYDYQPAPREIWDRTSMFSPDVVNPSAGGRLGGTLYAGYGPGRCNCDITKTYPWGFGPRLGVAYQLNDKTVLRTGIGVSYSQTSAFNYIGGGNSIGMGFNSLGFSNPTFGDAALLLRNGLSYSVADLTAASYDPGIRPQPGQTNNPPAWVDINGGVLLAC
jgi:outer membrane receptor protein involved in Fe transport